LVLPIAVGLLSGVALPLLSALIWRLGRPAPRPEKVEAAETDRPFRRLPILEVRTDSLC
jgi:hypothetical protein